MSARLELYLKHHRNFGKNERTPGNITASMFETARRIQFVGTRPPWLKLVVLQKSVTPHGISMQHRPRIGHNRPNASLNPMCSFLRWCRPLLSRPGLAFVH